MTDSYVKWKGWDRAAFGHCEKEDAVYYTRELKKSGIRSLAGLRIGELGYGNGTFAGWVQEAGGNWVGKEANPELRQRATEAGFAVIAPDVAFSSICGAGKLDLVFAWDVIEHMELDAIRSFFAEATDAL